MERDDQHFVLAVALNYDLIIYERFYYTILDLLSDIGGFQSILTGFCALLLSMIKHDHFDDYLVQHLFELAPTLEPGKE